MCWPPPPLARANTGRGHLPSNNGALWRPQPSPPSGRPTWTNTGAASIISSGVQRLARAPEARPGLPLRLEQEVCVGGPATLGRATALLGGAGCKGATLGKHGSCPQLPQQEQTQPSPKGCLLCSSLKVTKGSRSPPPSRLRVWQGRGRAVRGWGLDLPRPDPQSLLLRGQLREGW